MSPEKTQPLEAHSLKDNYVSARQWASGDLHVKINPPPSRSTPVNSVNPRNNDTETTNTAVLSAAGLSLNSLSNVKPKPTFNNTINPFSNTRPNIEPHSDRAFDVIHDLNYRLASLNRWMLQPPTEEPWHAFRATRPKLGITSSSTGRAEPVLPAEENTRVRSDTTQHVVDCQGSRGEGDHGG